MLFQPLMRRVCARFSSQRVTLYRASAPLLYAYDAYSFGRRLLGMHGLPPLGVTDALIIRPCKAIHTFRLKQVLEVVFVDRQGVIVKIVSVAPGKTAFCLRAALAVEVAEGTVERLSLKVGQVFTPDSGRWA